MIRKAILVRLIFYMIAIFVIYYAGFEDGQYFILSGILNIIYFTWFLWRDAKEVKYLHIGHFYIAGNLLLIGMGSIYLSSVIGTEKQFELAIAGLLPVEYLQESIFMIQLSVVFFLIGFYLTKARPRFLIKPFGYEPFIFPNDIALWGLVLISWVGSRVFHMFPGVLFTAFFCVPIAATYIFTVKFFKEPSLKFLYFFYIAVLIIIGYYFERSSPMRQAKIFILLPVLVGMGAIILDRWQIDHFRKIRRSYVAIGIACVLFSLFIIYVVLPAATLRKQYRYNMRAAIMAIVTDDKAREETAGTRELRVTTPLISNSIVLKFKDESVEIEFDPLVKIAAGFIPRWLWREKPIITSGNWFHKFLIKYQGQTWEGRANIAMTAAGELFWAYGWVGFILGMLFYGFLIGRINHSFFKKDLRNPFGIGLVLLTMMYCLKALEGGFAAPISLMFILSILAYVTNKCIGGKTPHGTAGKPRV